MYSIRDIKVKANIIVQQAFDKIYVINFSGGAMVLMVWQHYEKIKLSFSLFHFVHQLHCTLTVKDLEVTELLASKVQ